MSLRRVTSLAACLGLAAVPLAGCGSKEPGIPSRDASELIRLLHRAQAASDDPQRCSELAADIVRIHAKVQALPSKTDADVRSSLKNGVKNLADSARSQCQKTKTRTTPTTATVPTTATTPPPATAPPTTPPTAPPTTPTQTTPTTPTQTTPPATTPGTGGITPGNGNGGGTGNGNGNGTPKRAAGRHAGKPPGHGHGHGHDKPGGPGGGD